MHEREKITIFADKIYNNIIITIPNNEKNQNDYRCGYVCTY